MKNFKAVIILAAIAILSTGCGNSNGSKFIGHWVAVDKKAKSFIDIRKEGDIFHMDHSYNAPWKGADVMDVERMEGTAISEDVLRVGSGIASFDMRLEDGKIFLYEDGYSKAK